jgi:succinate dehydrogenase / fumarate reductase, cytochrome b subunit
MNMNFFRSSLGKKYVMAVSGFALLLFVIGHMLGNLQVFLGPDQINAYGNFLQTTPEILWSARLGLLVMVGLHLYAAITLWFENRAARPVPYGEYRPVAASLASRTMIMSGLVIAAFIVYHLLHYTVQVKAVNLTGRDFIPLEDAKGRHDIYRMMILGFSNGFVSFFYVLAVGLLCLHLSHGASSMVQSVGWKTVPVAPWVDRLALALAIILFLGYISIPLAVLTGVLK